MLIANPIYDAVFKYLMDDNKVAKLLLSAIIGKKIVKLDYRPTEIISEKKEKSLTVYHIDFSARIKETDGSESLVIIEIQKAMFPVDIMRFRTYLGEQYINAKNVCELNEPKVKYGKALPILSIYFLGHKLDHVKAPVIKVQRDYIDLASGKIIKEKEHFIECLTHDSFVIQIPFLTGNRQTELLKVLSVFDQSNRERDYHILNINEDDFPEKYRGIIRRLQRATSDKAMRTRMRAEDTALEGLKIMEREIMELREEIQEKKKVLEEQKKIIDDLKRKRG